MGAADIIPGVSGGTVALITGIYERLIDAIKSVNLLFVPYFFRGFADRRYFKKSKENFNEIDLKFLIPILSGIAVAFLLLANIIGFFRDGYPTYTSAFFFGLILSSSVFVYISFEKRIDIKSFLFIAIGIVVGFVIVGLEEIQTNHTLIIIFLCGTITICAMILPGISGAFILWILGQYDFMLGVLINVTHLNFSKLHFTFAYVLGGIVGILTFSRILSYLIKKYRVSTISFLLGLMLGALRMPGVKIMNNPENMILTVFSALIGITTVLLMGYYKYYLDNKSISA